MRRESNFLKGFKRRFLELFPNSFFLKISDFSVGIKPFDVILVHDGVPYAIELKTGSRLKKHQIFFLKKFKDAGGKSFVVFKEPEGYLILDFRTEKKKKFLDLRELIKYIITGTDRNSGSRNSS